MLPIYVVMVAATTCKITIVSGYASSIGHKYNYKCVDIFLFNTMWATES